MLQIIKRKPSFLFLFLFLSILNVDANQSERVGFKLFFNDTEPTIDIDTAVIRYRGIISFPMAGNLAEIWSELKGRNFSTIIVHLDSEGGGLSETKHVIKILKEIRKALSLKTLVYHGDRCLSACIPVFMQGEERIAGGASVWMFHGACRTFTNIPSLERTPGLYTNVTGCRRFRFVSLLATGT